MHREADIIQGRAQRRQTQHHVLGTGRVAHDADAPDLARERAEAGTDFQVEIIQQLLEPLDAIEV